MKKIIPKIIKYLFISFLLAVVSTLITSLLQNSPEASIVGAYYYGYPFHFLIKMPLLGRTEFILINFLKDLLVFWLVTEAFLIIVRLLRGRKQKVEAEWMVQRTRFLIIFILIGFFTKIMGEFIHEFFGHGSFVLLFGGKVTHIKISVLWPYTFSSIGWTGSFLPWQMAWIQGGGIFVCLIVSGILQALVIFRLIKDQWLSSFLFWLSFWTLLSSAGYFIIGGISPFGDVEYLISAGVLTRASSLLIGLGILSVAFFTLSWIFILILSRVGLIDDFRSIRISLALFWLLLLPITLMALLGGSWSPVYLPLSIFPTAIVLFLFDLSPGIFQVLRE